jgi:hypothetical protein
MKVRKEKIYGIAISILLLWSVIATCLAVYYHATYVESKERIYRELARIAIRVDLLIDYGNGTRRWHNDTLLPIGASVFNLTLTVAKVDYEPWPPYGMSVIAINDVRRDPERKFYWIWWYWNATTRKWTLGPVMSDKYMLNDGDIICWYYEKVVEWPPKPPA